MGGITFNLPCGVGDRVFAYLVDVVAPADDEIRKSKKGYTQLVECVIFEISIQKDRPEPLFTAISYENAEYATFWLSDFGKNIFTPEQFYALKPSMNRKKGGRR